jgi:hypothetical protein
VYAHHGASTLWVRAISRRIASASGVFTFREVVHQFEKILTRTVRGCARRVFRTLFEVVFEEINKGVERFAQNLVALAVEPAHAIVSRMERRNS